MDKFRETFLKTSQVNLNDESSRYTLVPFLKYIGI